MSEIDDYGDPIYDAPEEAKAFIVTIKAIRLIRGQHANLSVTKKYRVRYQLMFMSTKDCCAHGWNNEIEVFGPCPSLIKQYIEDSKLFPSVWKDYVIEYGRTPLRPPYLVAKHARIMKLDDVDIIGM